MRLFRRVLTYTSCLAIAVALAIAAQKPPDTDAEFRAGIDKAAREALAEAGVPSMSVAVVKDGYVSYVQAYGDARLDPETPATPAMRYSIGSISKQFTAAAILFLQEQGKLSLDDKVARFLPGLARADDVTIRQLLSHTAGYQDYWPQDYVPPFMLQPVTTEKIMDLWARKGLDFEPGTKWQYSNTNYVIAGAIVEKAAGIPLIEFLRERIFVPLGMKSVTDIDRAKLSDSDPTGYMRYALGPLRPAPKEGKGWLFAAGELAMTAEDLAKWDIALMERKLLRADSYRQMETEVLLRDGVGTHYALGLDVRTERGRRVLEHGGEVSGFTAQNTVYPDDRAAIVALTNQDAVGAAGALARKAAPLLFTRKDNEGAARLEEARKIFAGLQQGNIDRSLFTDNANSYFSREALEDFAAGLAPLGTPQEFAQAWRSLRGGMIERGYSVKFPAKSLRVWTFELPDGKLEQYQVAVL